MQEEDTRQIDQARRIAAALRMEARYVTEETVQGISDDTGISRKHLYDLERKHNKDPEMADLERSGRPLKVTKTMGRRMLRAIADNPFTPVTALTIEVNMGLPPEQQV